MALVAMRFLKDQFNLSTQALAMENLRSSVQLTASFVKHRFKALKCPKPLREKGQILKDTCYLHKNLHVTYLCQYHCSLLIEAKDIRAVLLSILKVPQNLKRHQP